ncbi:tryptophan-rich sensory protein [Paenibacillus oenotherae]|uniref:Tryptophan-rich sensory protein n=1 Tax=Paenibacillus oenotherae TaxID=1435645 RepID=A0ABS7D9P1_9BACL|nr:TspO/MBR family protein [Paenibacillus oenotherae]MBW7476576.1 tryptophan-rich sensory protein [Paenibacillus oenotherae]
MMHRHVYRVWNIVGIIAVIIVNLLAVLLPLNDKTTGELSAKHPVLITPAGYAFSIWSLIYLLLIGFAIYQATRSGARKERVLSIGPWFLISCLFNIAWIFVWHYEWVTSSGFIMIALLLTLIVIYRRVHLASPSPALVERLVVQLPFSIYLGWISVATIVNISVVLDHIGWDRFGLTDTAWTIIMLAVAVILALAVGFKFRDPFYMLVFVWALSAIAVKQEHLNETVAASAWIGAALILVAAFILVILTFRQRKIY